MQANLKDTLERLAKGEEVKKKEIIGLLDAQLARYDGERILTLSDVYDINDCIEIAKQHLPIDLCFKYIHQLEEIRDSSIVIGKKEFW